jgi:predicted 3-demethylubiquinone-9 3-methyltransferase (glyoxalase superfamily)
MQRITPFLWFDKEAGEAAKFYTSIFKDSKIKNTSTIPNTPSGTVEVVDIELQGQEFTLISAGPVFKFTEAISFVVHCQTQEEIDYYWERLSAGGEEGQCGWLKDKYGVSWQVVPMKLGALLQHNDPKKSQRAMQAMLQMKKLDIEALKQASEQQ